jgi:hypothetical protein
MANTIFFTLAFLMFCNACADNAGHEITVAISDGGLSKETSIEIKPAVYKIWPNLK